MTTSRIGFIGLGNIGKPIAGNVARAGREMIVFDIADMSDRAPEGAQQAGSTREVAQDAEFVFLSLPSLQAVASVVEEIAGSGASDLIVVNTSTVGPLAAREAHDRLAAAGMGYVDSPISGAVFRAYEGTLASIYSGSAEILERLRPLLETYSANIFHIGTEPGQGQIVKVMNNYLAIAGMVMVSEAVGYGVSQGLDMGAILNVINAASGQSFITEKLFPQFVQSGSFESGSTAAILVKDVSLFVDSANAAGAASELAETSLDILKRFSATGPDQDQLRIYEYLRDKGSA